MYKLAFFDVVHVKRYTVCENTSKYTPVIFALFYLYIRPK